MPEALHFSLAHAMLRLQGITLAEISQEGKTWLVAHLPPERLVRPEEEHSPAEDA